MFPSTANTSNSSKPVMASGSARKLLPVVHRLLIHRSIKDHWMPVVLNPGRPIENETRTCMHAHAPEMSSTFSRRSRNTSSGSASRPLAPKSNRCTSGVSVSTRASRQMQASPTYIRRGSNCDAPTPYLCRAIALHVMHPSESLMLTDKGAPTFSHMRFTQRRSGLSRSSRDRTRFPSRLASARLRATVC